MNEAVIFWIILAVVLGIVEATTTSLVSIWAAVAALICAVISSSGISNDITALIFVGITAVFIVLTRPLTKRFVADKAVHTNADRIIGKDAVVIKEIRPNIPGQININGHVWSAEEKNGGVISEGAFVKVLSIEGVRAIVEEII